MSKYSIIRIQISFYASLCIENKVERARLVIGKNKTKQDILVTQEREELAYIWEMPVEMERNG